MKSKQKANTERWSGLLLVLLGGFSRLRQLPGRSSPPVRPRRILFIGLSDPGYAVLAHPAMKKAADGLAAELFFTTYTDNRESLDLLRTIRPAAVFTIRTKNIFLLVYDILRFFRFTRRQKIDSVIDLQTYCRFSALLSGLSGAPNRIGFYDFHQQGVYRGDLLTHRVSHNPHIDQASNFIALVNSLLAAEAEVPYSKQAVSDEEAALPKMLFHESELANMHEQVRRHYPEYDRSLHRLVIVSPLAAGRTLRRWLPERYVQLMRRILEAAPEALVLVTGEPEDKEETALLCRMAGSSRCINFAGSVRFEQLPVLYSIAELMVSDYCRSCHVLSLTGLPAFILFGPDFPPVSAPQGDTFPLYAGLACSPCIRPVNYGRTPCRDNKCMQAITVDQVFAAIQPILYRNTHPDRIEQKT